MLPYNHIWRIFKMERWSKEKAWDFWNNIPWLIGCNYVPSLTPGLSIWQEDTIEEILPCVRKELSLMQSIAKTRGMTRTLNC